MNYTYVVYNTKKTYLHLQSDRIEILWIEELFRQVSE
jgi:hypothetical protein